GMFADITASAFADQTSDVNFGAGLGEREKRRPEPDLRFLAEQFFGQVINGLFQIGEAYVFIYKNAFYLVEHAMRARRNSFVAENAARHNGTDGRLVVFHDAHLHRRSMRS